MKKLCRLLLIVGFLCGLIPTQGFANDLYCGMGFIPCGVASVQGMTLLNTQTTGGAAAAVVTTLAAVVGTRANVYSIDARCNTATETSNVTITDGGTTIWTSGGLAVTAAAPFYRVVWPVALTGATNSAVVITLAACATGTGTLIVQASRW